MSRGRVRFLMLSMAIACLGAVRGVPAQAGEPRWVIDPKASLAWWQILPHLEHLFATTCPQDPSWIPGWGRSGGSGWHLDVTVLKVPPVWDTVHIPIFRRRAVRPICTPAVQGELVAPDTISWRGVRGRVVVQAKELITGQRMRDAFARDFVLEIKEYPEIRFTFDSIVDVTRGRGDTLRARAVGTLLVHGVGKPINAAFTAWREAGGIRVLTRFHLPAPALTDEFHMSKYALGLGVRMGVWKEIWMGADLVLHPETR